MTALAPALQAFFTDRLITQRNCSPQTIAAYRDTFRLLLRYAQAQTGKQPFELDIDDLHAPLIGAFLTHLERDRGNSARTRNARLAQSTRSTVSPRSSTPSTHTRSRV
jgi:site-specific recombinase XerD